MEEQLDDRVSKVGESGPAREESTEGLIHLEETLSSAQDKAKKLVTLRLKLDEEAAADSATTDVPSDAERGNDARVDAVRDDDALDDDAPEAEPPTHAESR
jgi:hypothetical protein